METGTTRSIGRLAKRRALFVEAPVAFFGVWSGFVRGDEIVGPLQN